MVYASVALPAAGGALHRDSSAPPGYASSFAHHSAAVESAVASLSAKDFNASRAAADATIDTQMALTTSWSAQGMSREWLEMYEIYESSGVESLAPKSGGAAGSAAAAGAAAAAGVIRSLHCSALPGSPIFALNHYLASVGGSSSNGAPVNFQWAACSPYPGGGHGGSDDTFNIFTCNRDRWLMDGPGDRAPSASGDAASKKHVTGEMVGHGEAEEVSKRAIRALGGKAHIITAGAAASEGAAAEFSTVAEAQTLRVLAAECACALRVLEVGGMLVVRVHTWELQLTRTILAILSELFEQARLVIPSSTHPDSLRAYLVATKFKTTDAGDSIVEHAIHALDERARYTPEGEFDHSSHVQVPYMGGARTWMPSAEFDDSLKLAASSTYVLASRSAAMHKARSHKKQSKTCRDEFKKRWLHGKPIVRLWQEAAIPTQLEF